jgi:hypothetical protein
LDRLRDRYAAHYQLLDSSEEQNLDNSWELADASDKAQAHLIAENPKKSAIAFQQNFNVLTRIIQHLCRIDGSPSKSKLLRFQV